MTCPARTLGRFARDRRGAAGAEFALVLPLMLIFLLGILDVGYYAWQLNRAEKATQTGTRWAVATRMVPEDLIDYSFATDGGLEQGTLVPQGSFPTVTCTVSSCTQWGHDQASFDAIVARMQDIKSEIEPGDVQITYEWSGLGYAGDPNGPDVAPIVTVRLAGMTHTPMFSLLTGEVPLPTLAYSLTAEDSVGGFAN